MCTQAGAELRQDQRKFWLDYYLIGEQSQVLHITTLLNIHYSGFHISTNQIFHICIKDTHECEFQC